MEATTNKAALLDVIRNSVADPRRRLMLRGGYVLSMDPAIGNLIGDVLIEGYASGSGRLETAYARGGAADGEGGEAACSPAS